MEVTFEFKLIYTIQNVILTGNNSILLYFRAFVLMSWTLLMWMYDGQEECTMPRYWVTLHCGMKDFRTVTMGTFTYLKMEHTREMSGFWLHTEITVISLKKQTQFNFKLSSNCQLQVIEIAFGLLKRRFRRLKFINMKSIRDGPLLQHVFCTTNASLNMTFLKTYWMKMEMKSWCCYGRVCIVWEWCKRSTKEWILQIECNWIWM